MYSDHTTEVGDEFSNIRTLITNTQEALKRAQREASSSARKKCAEVSVCVRL